MPIYVLQIPKDKIKIQKKYSSKYFNEFTRDRLLHFHNSKYARTNRWKLWGGMLCLFNAACLFFIYSSYDESSNFSQTERFFCYFSGIVMVFFLFTDSFIDPSKRSSDDDLINVYNVPEITTCEIIGCFTEALPETRKTFLEYVRKRTKLDFFASIRHPFMFADFLNSLDPSYSISTLPEFITKQTGFKKNPNWNGNTDSIFMFIKNPSPPSRAFERGLASTEKNKLLCYSTLPAANEEHSKRFEEILREEIMKTDLPDPGETPTEQHRLTH